MTLPLDDPAALEELTAACDAYEKALMANDLDVLDGLFWSNPKTVRYGVGENLYGIDEIRAFRTGRKGGSPQREVIRREITTLGPDVGICNLEFRRVGSARTGRQSQTWIRTADGWRVISAHVSLMQDGS